MEDIKVEIQKGLRVGRSGRLVEWGTLLAELITEAETSYVDETGTLRLYFGEKEVFPDITLNLSTPFDAGKHQNRLNHFETDINSDDVAETEKNLAAVFADPTEKSEKFGFYRKWSIEDIVIEIVPRFHHGSDWSSIVISNTKS